MSTFQRLSRCLLGQTCNRLSSSSLHQPWHTPHLAAGSEQPKIDPAQLSLYNMRLCPWAQRTVLVLLAKGLSFVNININLRNKPDWFVEDTLGQVPVILHEGNVIPESLINCDYLDEKFSDVKLHPASPESRAENKLILNNMTKKLTHAKTLFTFMPFPEFAPTSEDRQETFSIILKELNSLNNVLQKRGHTFFNGDRPMMLDLMLWPFFERLEMFPLLYPEEKLEMVQYNSLKHVSAWVNAMKSIDYVDQYRIKPDIFAEWASVYFTDDDFDYDTFIQHHNIQ